MANYPPGVSGNEWQIAGRPIANLRDMQCNGKVYHGNGMADFDYCRFVGDVEGEYADGMLYWDCPECETENEYEEWGEASCD